MLFYSPRDAVLSIPFPFGILGMWNSTVSVPDHCTFMWTEISLEPFSSSAGLSSHKIKSVIS